MSHLPNEKQNRWLHRREGEFQTLGANNHDTESVLLGERGSMVRDGGGEEWQQRQSRFKGRRSRRGEKKRGVGGCMCFEAERIGMSHSVQRRLGSQLSKCPLEWLESGSGGWDRGLRGTQDSKRRKRRVHPGLKQLD